MTAFLAAFAAPNACSMETPCDSTGGMCETGLAAGMRSAGYNFFCGLSVPLGALPTGGGQLCFDTQVGLAPPSRAALPARGRLHTGGTPWRSASACLVAPWPAGGMRRGAQRMRSERALRPDAGAVCNGTGRQLGQAVQLCAFGACWSAAKRRRRPVL